MMRWKCIRLRTAKLIFLIGLVYIVAHHILGRTEPQITPLGIVGKPQRNHIFHHIPGSSYLTVPSTNQNSIPDNTSSRDATNTTLLDNVFISVKTSGKFHSTRVGLQLKTWFTLASTQTYFFTDVDDIVLNNITNNHAINTQCGALHTRDNLCCKMSFEFDSFIRSNKKWWCHVDDDTYLNVPAMLNFLHRYHHQQDWYFGRVSVSRPMKFRNPDVSKGPNIETEFQFATGGAGFCLSRGLGLKMVPYASGGKFSSLCYNLRLPDDCLIGVIITHYLHTNLTVSNLFASHLHALPVISVSQLRDQITVGFSNAKPSNRINVPGFNITEDPSRFLSLHCFLFPSIAVGCPSLPKSL